MGYGDNLMATGLARGAAERGKRIAFGDGRRIIWDQHSHHIFERNPNVAAPGSEGSPDLEYIPHYKGSRLYNRQAGLKWVWNYDFKAVPGEMFFAEHEIVTGKRLGKGFILIESNVPTWKASAGNKDWGRKKYQAVATELQGLGHKVVQLVYGREPPLSGVQPVITKSFRDALAILRCAKFFIGPEGGLHHGAAAVKVPGVVIFGGFIPPAVTGYDLHVNLTGGAKACGSIRPCDHCREAMNAILVEHVLRETLDRLRPSA